ncbi:hypothetical protein RFI_18479, partial [Reticulomyxa filosa]
AKPVIDALKADKRKYQSCFKWHQRMEFGEEWDKIIKRIQDWATALLKSTEQKSETNKEQVSTSSSSSSSSLSSAPLKKLEWKQNTNDIIQLLKDAHDSHRHLQQIACSVAEDPNVAGQYDGDCGVKNVQRCVEKCLVDLLAEN